MTYQVRELRRDDMGDAAGLADLWNRSDAGWPGGFTSGVAVTPAGMLERKGRVDRLGIFVVENERELVGYGDLCAMHGRGDLAYLALLNVRPDWHGRGCGKALILSILGRTIELGYRRLMLHTWAGNLKAVPLYKKTGFFWRPDSSVEMINYIPTALAMPLARPFFDRHDWYSTFRRDLSVKPDEQLWHATQVYEYGFEADGERFAMWIDRHAEAPTAVETNDLYAACWIDAEEVVAGLPHTITWEIVDRRGAGPRQVALLAHGEAGIALDVSESLEVEGTATVTRRFTAPPDIARPQPGMPPHAIRSTLLVDGVPITLAAAVRVVQPVEIGVDARTLLPGKPNVPVTLKLRNRTEHDLHGHVDLAPADGLRFDRLIAPFHLPAKSWTSVELNAAAEREGAFATRVRAVLPAAANPDLGVAGAALATRAQPVALRTVPLEGLFWWQDPESETLTVESPLLRLTVSLRSGSWRLQEQQSGRDVFGSEVPSLGPPFNTWHAAPPGYDHRVVERDGRIAVTVTMPSLTLPDLTVDYTLTLGAGPWLRVEHRVTNLGEQEAQPALQVGGWFMLQGRRTVPLVDGLVRQVHEGWGDWPVRGDTDMTKQPDDYAESWFACEADGLVGGLVWETCREAEGGRLLFDLPALPPRSTAAAPAYHVVAARGDWSVVRALWQRLHQPAAVREEQAPQPTTVLTAGFTPPPLLVTGTTAAATLEIANRRLKKLEGEWAVQADGAAIEPAAGELPAVKLGEPARVPLTVRLDDTRPRVIDATLTVTSDITAEPFEAAIVVVGSGTSVEVAEADGLWSVVNGHLAFDVAPAHAGCVVSLRDEGGRELLKSSYPEPCAYRWMNPWYGGCYPNIGNWGDAKLNEERWSAEAIERQGDRGLCWRGVRLANDLEHKDHRWLRREVEYLTLPGSNLLAIVLRGANRTDATMSTPMGVAINLADCDGARLHHDVLGCDREPAPGPTAARWRRSAGFGVSVEPRGWVAVELGETVLALAAGGRQWQVGCSLPTPRAAETGGGGGLRLEAHEVKERVLWLALAPSVDEARGYAALTELEALP